MTKLVDDLGDKHSPKTELLIQIQTLGLNYDLIFFFQSTCKDAATLAANLTKFRDIYGWHVWAVSLDARGFPEFPAPLTAEDLWHTFDIKVHPALIAINRLTQTWVPLAYGAPTLENIERKVIQLPR